MHANVPIDCCIMQANRKDLIIKISCVAVNKLWSTTAWAAGLSTCREWGGERAMENSKRGHVVTLGSKVLHELIKLK